MGHYPTKINDPDPNLSVRVNATGHKEIGGDLRVMGVLSRTHIVDDAVPLPLLSPFLVDRTCTENQITACVHRFGRRMPPIDAARAKDFWEYATRLVRTFRPVSDDDCVGTELWLKSAPYTEDRRQYLLSLKAAIGRRIKRTADSESFIKDEGYCEPKHPRAINSPSDESKSILGSIIKPIDKATFQCPAFVKGTDPKTWPAKLAAKFGDRPVFETDFSSFEAHHRGVYGDLGHYWLQHQLRPITSSSIRKLIGKLVKGTNSTKFRGARATIPGRLMSGALWTSSMNGVLNYCILSYLACRSQERSCSPEFLVKHVDKYFRGFIEGDDGICEAFDLNKNLIRQMGLDLKLERANRFTEASFCGIVCGEKTMDIITDPKKFLRNFFSMSTKYGIPNNHLNKDWKIDSKHRALMRAKALSYSYGFKNCPIVGPLAYKICELTSGIRTEGVSVPTGFLWSGQDVKVDVHTKPCIADESRLVMQQRFGVSLLAQKNIEDRILEMRLNEPLALPLVELIGHHDVHHAFHFLSKTTGMPDVWHETPNLIKHYLYKGAKWTTQGVAREDESNIHNLAKVIDRTYRGEVFPLNASDFVDCPGEVLLAKQFGTALGL